MNPNFPYGKFCWIETQNSQIIKLGISSNNSRDETSRAECWSCVVIGQARTRQVIKQKSNYKSKVIEVVQGQD